jgi:DNA repair exonuclease SbcCD ATPase subunit
MEGPLPTTSEAEEASFSRSVAAAGQQALGRIYSFRFVYVAILAFILLYVFTVKGVESLLDQHFRMVVDEAIVVTDLESSVASQIQTRIDERVRDSVWVRAGGVQVTTIVLGQDGMSWIYVGGRAVPPPPSLELGELVREAERLLPATADVVVAVPHNALIANVILIAYAALLLQSLWLYQRSIAQRETQRLEDALASRNAAAERTRDIEHELEEIRSHLLTVEPAEREHAEEIGSLQRERLKLQSQLSALAGREEELRGKAAQAIELDQERQALEDLLDEATSELSSKETEIQKLEQSLKKASREPAAKTGGRVREAQQLTRRFATLYKNLEFDERAVDDVVALRDETMKLKCEENLKRLADDADNVSVRRKVGGLPPHLTIFELGFAGKGRIYYTKGKQRRFRVLCVGAKNTQNAAIEYLRRL